MTAAPLTAAFVGLMALASVPASAQSGAPRQAGEVLIERTLALVGGAVITQADVDLATTLRLLDDVAGPLDRAPLERLIDRQLMLHEVARFAPPDPAPLAVQARLQAIRARTGSPADVVAALTRAGSTVARLESWVRDDLRMAAYVDSRFASAGTPTEVEIAAYLRTHGEALAAAGVAPADRVVVARQRVIDERRRGLVADWLVDLRRRAEVLEFKG